MPVEHGFVKGREEGLPSARDRMALRNVPSMGDVLARNSREAAFIGAMLDASPDCIKYVELDGTLSVMNANGMCAMEIDDFCYVDGQQWANLWPEGSASLVREAVTAAREGRPSRFEAFCPTAKGTPRWWDVSVAPVPDENGEPMGIVSISRDVTAAVRGRETLAEARRVAEEAREQAELALREVNHRVKNLFALVPAIVQLSARAAPDMTSLVRGIRERVGSLARSHTLTLTASSETEGVALEALIRAVLEPYENQSEAFSLIGPSLRLSASEANAMSLTLHELATNAAKHGALAGENGRIAISWSVAPAADPDAQGGERDLALTWRETDGPPVPARRGASGFGTQLIDRLVRAQGGTIARDWRRVGLVVSVTLPLAHVAETEHADGKP